MLHVPRPLLLISKLPGGLTCSTITVIYQRIYFNIEKLHIYTFLRITLSIGENHMEIYLAFFEFILKRKTQRRTLFMCSDKLVPLAGYTLLPIKNIRIKKYLKLAHKLKINDKMLFYVLEIKNNGCQKKLNISNSAIFLECNIF